MRAWGDPGGEAIHTGTFFGHPVACAAALATLDARDLEILELMVQGLPTSQVAARLYLAPKTIRNWISEMMGKLGVTSRLQAARRARRTP